MAERREQFHAEAVEQWQGWLEERAATSKGVWLVGWKSHTGRPRIPYEDAVLEALAVGWIDSQAATLDEDRSMQWFSPRRPTSGWSRPNKARVARLESEGRMRPAGRRMVELAKQSGTWTKLDLIEDLVVPEDLAAAFDAHPGSAEQWESFPRSARRAILEWVANAKRPQTRARRVQETAEKASHGERANQWRPKS